LVEVGIPVHGILLDLAKHFVGHLGHAGFGVAVGCRGVAVHGAEVAVTVDEGIAHGKVLGQAHQGVIDRGVAMGMVPTQNIAHGGGALAVGLVLGEAVFIHGVEDAPVDGLEAVADVGQRPADDDRHGIVDVGVLHLLHQLGFYDRLVWKSEILGVVIL